MKDQRAAYRELQSLGLSGRTITCLLARDIQSPEQLAALTEWDLTVMPGIGPKAFDELKNHVQRNAPTPADTYERPRQVSVIFKPQTLAALDNWASENGLTSRSDAVRSLVDRALETSASGLHRRRSG
jgi:hypothetical protein